METVLGWLLQRKYYAMFGILFLCGMGLPLPEEVTLVGSGLLVGWGEANFWIASAVCVAGILAGDSIIFGLGHHYGQIFLRSRFMRFFLSPRRQAKVGRLFAKHGAKAVFFARFFAGVRVGVYAYAGSQRMAWPRFLFLDLMGALISGPTSVFIGKIAAENLVDRDEAIARAREMVNRFGHWLLIGAVLAILFYTLFHIRRNRRAREAAARMADSAGESGGPEMGRAAGAIPGSVVPPTADDKAAVPARAPAE